MLRVVVTGSESTGKTTLALALGRTWRAAVVPEYSRRYAELVERPLAADDVDAIALGQITWEDEAAARHATEPLLVLDTDLLSTTVYAEHYYGLCPAWILRAARARRGDLYLLCAPDLPWEADGIRDAPDSRAQIHDRFKRRLAEIGAQTIEITGTGERRFLEAEQAVGSFLSLRRAGIGMSV